MIFITGPLCSGKKEAAKNILRCDGEALASRAVWDVQDLAATAGDLEGLAEELARRDLGLETTYPEDFTELQNRMEDYMAEFDKNGLNTINIDI